MTVGEKIKKIRTFRGMTQKELGLAIGFEEKGADNRIAQYETNYRVPKRELLDKIAQALRVDQRRAKRAFLAIWGTEASRKGSFILAADFRIHSYRRNRYRLFREVICRFG